MDRKDFLATIGNAAAFICVGCMASCVKETPIPAGASSQFIVNLNNQIRNVGDYMFKGPIIVIRVALGNSPSSFSVLNCICPHQGFTVGYFPEANDPKDGHFECPGHGATFTQAGTKIQGPSPTSLDRVPFNIVGTSLIIKT